MNIVACLLCLGFWQLGAVEPPSATPWIAQNIMQNHWERVSAGGDASWPWPWNHTWPMARLSARSGEIDLVVLAGGGERTLAYGPGHLSASASPGAEGNSVIVGRADTHFSFLKDMAIGESMTVETVDGRLHVYSIVDLGVVHARNGTLALDTDGAYLSLVTRYPFQGKDRGDGLMRYVVTARKVL